MTRDDEQDLLTTPTPRVSLDDAETGNAAPKRFPERSHAGHQGGKAAPEEAYCPACGASYPPDQSVCPREGARLIKLKAQGDPMLGRVLDARYEVRSPLGEGGMGTVYRGLQLSVDREVAIKVIHASLASDRTSVKRFLREARLSSRLAQPSIVNVYDFGQTDDGVLYLVMELLRGHTLASELESGQPMVVKRAAHMALQLCDALESAHIQGIIHRDLKPGNIIVLDDPPGRDLIKVLDFGLAKSLVAESSSRVTMTNAMLGTPMYMAPEQINGLDADQRADIYALGCIMFHMLVGRAPYGGDTVNVVLTGHMNDPVPPLPPHVPAGLAHTIQRMLAKEVDHRVKTVTEVREVLQSVLSAPLAPAPAPSKTPAVFESVAIDPNESLFSSAPFKPTVRGATEGAKASERVVAKRPMGKIVAILGALIAIPLIVMAASGGSSDAPAAKQPNAESVQPSKAAVEPTKPMAPSPTTTAATTTAPTTTAPANTASSATVPVNTVSSSSMRPAAPSSTTATSKPSSSSKRTKPERTTEKPKPPATQPAAVVKPAEHVPQPQQPTGPSIDFYPSKKK